MSAVTESVSKAMRTCNNGDAWSLYLDKLCFNSAQSSPPGGKGESPKSRALRDVCDAYRRSESRLELFVERGTALRQRLAAQYGPEQVRIVHLRTVSRLLLHLARANPLENVGLYAERITGLPMIPGPAVKGVVSTWACWCQYIEPDGGFPAEFATNRRLFDRTEAALAARVLGDNNPRGSTAAGEVVFLGAWPDAVPSLELDITTPHPNEERREGPIPNPFLAVAPGTDWSFVLIAKPREGSDANALLDAAERWLTEALEQAGLGAKTAAGYGRFCRLTETELAVLRKREAEATKKAADAQAAQLAKAKAEAEMANLQSDAVMLARLAAIKNDGDLFGQVNAYKTEEGTGGYRWPGTRAEQLAVLEYCTGTAWNRVSGNRNCRKAIANLARKFNRELPA